MEAGVSARCTTLATVWQWWAETVRSIDEAGWRRQTRLEGWDVAALTAHHATLVHGLGRLASQPVDAVAGMTASTMLRRFNEPGGAATTMAPAVATTARQRAASVSRADLVAVFEEAAPQVVDTVRAAGPVVVDYFGHGTMPLEEAAAIAVLEAVVHGLDLAAALEIDAASLPDDALREVVTLLASMADPVEFITTATGRGDARVLPVLR
jgi:uncharacterized protein (TIGR03083 family)